MHVCNRITFGPTPALMASLTNGSLTPLQFINQQLVVNASAPDPNPDIAALENQLIALGLLPAVQNQSGNEIGMQGMGSIRAAFAANQLNEVMTRFWNQHFNRSLSQIQFAGPLFVGGLGQARATFFMKEDEEFYRQNAMGFFDDLLRHTAGSVAMLTYLDNYLSTRNNLNENWGRELLELFSMGERDETTGVPNYAQTDVVGVALCFTGWTVVNNGGLASSIFDDNLHDTTAKNLFTNTPHPLTIAPGGTAQFDGDRVVSHLAGADATKDFIVRKLMVLFFGDDGPSNHPVLLAAAKNQWGTRGDINAVLTTLLTSTEFLTAADRWHKVKDPLRFNASLLRAVGADARNAAGNLDVLTMFVSLVAVDGMGQSLYSYPSPDGYPLGNSRQLGIGGYADRIDSAERYLPEANDPWRWSLFPWNPQPDVIFRPDVLVLAGGAPPTGADAVAGFLLQLFFADKPLNAQDGNLVSAELGTLPTPGTTAYADRIRETCELILSMTHFQLH